MFCTQCGFKLKDGALFCTQCGKQISPRISYTAQPQVIVEPIQEVVEPTPVEIEVAPVKEEIVEVAPIIVEEKEEVVVQPQIIVEKPENVVYVGVCPHCGEKVTLLPEQVQEQACVEEEIVGTSAAPIEEATQTEQAVMPAYEQPQTSPAPKTAKGNGVSILSIVGFSIAMISFIFVFITAFLSYSLDVFIMGAVLSIAGIIVSGIGVPSASKKGQQCKVLGILGIVFSIVSLAYYVYVIITVIMILSAFGIL